MSIVKDPSRYQRDRVLTEDGKVRHSATNGDAVAKAMFGMSRQRMEECAETNGVADRMAKHAAAPNGRYRMNLGNILRGLVRNGKAPKIGEHTITDLKQDVTVTNYAPPVAPKPAKEPKPAAAAAKTDEPAADTSLEAANRKAEQKRLAEASAKTAGKKVQGRKKAA